MSANPLSVPIASLGGGGGGGGGGGEGRSKVNESVRDNRRKTYI